VIRGALIRPDPFDFGPLRSTGLLRLCSSVGALMVIDSWVPHEDPMLTRQDWCILRFVIRHAFVLAVAAALCEASVSNADVLSRGALMVIDSRASVYC